MTGYDVSFEGLGITGIYIEPVAFQIGGISIYWYSIMLTFAVFFCMFLAMRKAKYSGLKQDDIMDTFIAIVVFMIVGARLFFVAFSWDLYKYDLVSIFSTRSGGLAFYGGVIGGLFGIWLVCKIKKVRFSRMTDYLVVYVPLGQAIGRWGNFFNQEAFGTNTTLPWGMYSEQTNAYLKALGLAGLDPEKPVHPTFLYEFIGNLVIFWILSRVRREAKKPFEVTVWYILLYGLLRFFVEGIRTDALFIGNTTMRISQVLSAVMVVVALIALTWFYRKSRMVPEALAGTGLETLVSDDAEAREDSGSKLEADPVSEDAANKAADDPDRPVSGGPEA